MKWFKHIIFVMLILATVFSACLGFAFADCPDSSMGALIRDADSIDALNVWIDNTCAIQNFNDVEVSAAYWQMVNDACSSSGVGACSSYNDLVNCSQTWNGFMHRYSPGNLLRLFIECLLTSDWTCPTSAVAWDSELSVYRLYEMKTKLWVVNSSGHFPYYRPPVDEDGNVPAVDTTGVKWLPYKDAIEKQSNRHFVTKDVLDDMAAYYDGVVIVSGKYYVITTTDPIGGGYLYLCDPHGFPYLLTSSLSPLKIWTLPFVGWRRISMLFGNL